jgi:hypothetical protein
MSYATTDEQDEREEFCPLEPSLLIIAQRHESGRKF